MNLNIEKSETQNKEFKESWRDEYIKWICGFANANMSKSKFFNEQFQSSYS